MWLDSELLLFLVYGLECEIESLNAAHKRALVT